MTTMQYENGSVTIEVNRNYSDRVTTGCGKWALRNNRTGEYLPYICKSGRCSNPACQSAWSKRKLGTCYALVDKYDFDCFFTLTLDPKLVGLQEAWENIQSYWSKFRKRMARYLKSIGAGKFEFFCVLEEQSGKRLKEGQDPTHYPHIHGFCTWFLSERQVIRHWAESCGGEVEVRREGKPDWYYWVTRGPSQCKVIPLTDKEGASFYMSKYCSKDEMLEGLQWTEPKTKTFWRSIGLRSDLEYKKYLDRKGREAYIALSKIPVVSGDWELVKENIYGEEECEGDDMERTFPEASEGSPREGFPNMEAEEGEGKSEQETFCTQEAAGRTKWTDKTYEGDVRHGQKKQRYEAYTRRSKSGEGRIPDNRNKEFSRYSTGGRNFAVSEQQRE